MVVELRDYGRGLDREKILQKAYSKGLVDADKELSDLEVYNLIFLPGFSTAEKVTEVSGSGSRSPPWAAGGSWCGCAKS